MPRNEGFPEDIGMRGQSFGLVVLMVLGIVAGGGSPAPPTDSEKPRVLTGKIVRATGPNGKPTDRGLTLASDDGSNYPIVEDAGSRMLFTDVRLRNRPVRLTALRAPGKAGLQVVRVQTIRDGAAYDVDYWCEICQISQDCPGQCVCCGEEAEFRERPAR